MMKNEDLKKLLKGSTIVDATFDDFCDGDNSLKSLTLVTKEERVLLVTVQSTSSWEGLTLDWLEVLDDKTYERLG